jgi:hypothetical protein
MIAIRALRMCCQKRVLLSKGYCYYPNSYTLRAHKIDPRFENPLLSTGISNIRIAIIPLANETY